ncbi:MAG: glutamate racemase [Chloroflexi bacterium]|nr:glutamate racemase [Chloroflexota bacterium]
MSAAGLIGVFDSGVGGLSVWREIVRLMPGEDTIYLADQAHVPYGTQSLGTVRYLSEGIARFLIDRGARVIVIACNTASAAALWHLRRTFPNVPFVGMEPAIKPAVEHTRTGIVGVIATPATFQGDLFASLLERYAGDVRVLTQVCPGLVEAIEAGALDTPATDCLLRDCLSPLVEQGIDQLVLGCTHYPFVRPAIERIVGHGVAIVDPAAAVARQVARVLGESRKDRSGQHTFYTSGNAPSLSKALGYLISEVLDGSVGDCVAAVGWTAGHLSASTHLTRISVL